MRILVIGGAGYIGAHLVHDLCEQNHDVTVYDNLTTGHQENLPARVNFINGDILNSDELNSALKNDRFTLIYHFAALKAAGDSMVDPGSFAKQNLSGSINVLNAMVENDVKFIVFSSSAAVYGYPEYLPIDENHPTVPINFYGHTKLEIEHLLNWYHKLKGINFAALRYFNAAGYDRKGRITLRETGSANLLPVVFETLTGERKSLKVFGDTYPTPDGSCIRDYIHVSDLSSAHLLAADYIIENQKSVTVNLGAGKGYSVFEVLDKIRKITRRKIPAEIIDKRPGDPAELIADAEQAKSVLGWQPRYSDLETIITTMWDLYKK